METLIIFLHVFSPTGQPLPSSSSKRKREGKEAQKGLGRALAQPPEVKAPGRAANPAPLPSTSVHSVESKASPAAAPTLPRPWLLREAGDDGACELVLSFGLETQKYQFQSRLLSGVGPRPRPWAHSWAGAGPLGSVRKFPPAPGLTPPAARTPQTVPMLKTSLVFGFFVCFEFIQSLRNLWFWLEI